MIRAKIFALLLLFNLDIQEIWNSEAESVLADTLKTVLQLSGGKTDDISAHREKDLSKTASAGFNERIQKHGQLLADDLNIDISPIREYFSNRSSIIYPAICKPANAIISYFFTKIRKLHSEDTEIFKEALDMCKYIMVSSGITTLEVCVDYIQNFIDIFLFIAKGRPKLSAELLTAKTFQHEGCTTTDEIPSWKLNIEPYRGPNLITSPEKPITEINLEKRTKIIHITDLFLDPYYLPRGNNICLERFLCCRISDNLAQNESEEAGFFTDHKNCGVSNRFLNKTLKHLSAKHGDAKLIYFSGNILAPNSWNKSREEVAKIVLRVLGTINYFLPHMKLIFTLSNYDVFPINLYSPAQIRSGRFSNTWINDVIYEKMINVNQEDQAIAINEGGYFSYDYDTKLKIISCNGNFCHSLNIWNAYFPVDPGGFLYWLLLELTQAEEADMVVHILSSIPPGNPACDQIWSREFYRLINRFKHIIKGIFCGYTRNDEFKLYYDPKNNSQPIVPVFIGGSLSSYPRIRKHNNNYKIYYAHEDSHWEILDWETWVLNLEKANNYPRVEFEFNQLYTASKAYGFNTSLTMANNLHNLIKKFISDPDLFRIYYKYYFKLTARDEEANCDAKCRSYILCEIVKPYYGEQEQCKMFNSIDEGLKFI